MNLLDMAKEYARTHETELDSGYSFDVLADFAEKVLADYNAKLEEWDDCRACAEIEQPCRAHRETVRR